MRHQRNQVNDLHLFLAVYTSKFHISFSSSFTMILAFQLVHPDLPKIILIRFDSRQKINSIISNRYIQFNLTVRPKFSHTDTVTECCYSKHNK